MPSDKNELRSTKRDLHNHLKEEKKLYKRLKALNDDYEKVQRQNDLVEAYNDVYDSSGASSRRWKRVEYVDHRNVMSLLLDRVSEEIDKKMQSWSNFCKETYHDNMFSVDREVSILKEMI